MLLIVNILDLRFQDREIREDEANARHDPKEHPLMLVDIHNTNIDCFAPRTSLELPLLFADLSHAVCMQPLFASLPLLLAALNPAVCSPCLQPLFASLPLSFAALSPAVRSVVVL